MLSSSTASRSPFSAGEGKGTVIATINPNLKHFTITRIKKYVKEKNEASSSFADE